MNRAERITSTVSAYAAERVPSPSARASRGVSCDWWKRTIVYRIYPLPFQDSNGDDVCLSTHLDRSGESGPTLALRPDEGVILKLGKA